MKEIEFKRLNKDMEDLEEMIFEWYCDKKEIHDMDLINHELRNREPRDILNLVEYANFTLEDDYFYFEDWDTLASLNRRDIIEEIEELTEEEIEELEEYLINELGEDE